MCEAGRHCANIACVVHTSTNFESSVMNSCTVPNSLFCGAIRMWPIGGLFLDLRLYMFSFIRRLNT